MGPRGHFSSEAEGQRLPKQGFIGLKYLPEIRSLNLILLFLRDPRVFLIELIPAFNSSFIVGQDAVFCSTG